jgi:hypothetical protein
LPAAQAVEHALEVGVGGKGGVHAREAPGHGCEAAQLGAQLARQPRDGAAGVGQAAPAVEPAGGQVVQGLRRAGCCFPFVH